MKNNFVALDFETSYGNIPCSIGIVEFINGDPANQYYSLIRPYELKINPINSRKNGIKLEHVINEREFNQIWEEIAHFIKDRVLVCHNSSFDITVLNNILALYGISKPTYSSFCTYKISKQCLDLKNYRLPTVAQFFSLSNFNHHNALEDALMCGKIFYNLCCNYEVIKPDQTKNKSKNTSSYRSYIGISVLPKPSFNAYIWNTSDKLAGKIFVVSGVFEKFSRDELKQAIEDNGGKVGSSISSKTHYVVAGDNMGPAKLQKAEQLGVKIISEDEFLQMIQE